jgi:hypothetical protein
MYQKAEEHHEVREQTYARGGVSVMKGVQRVHVYACLVAVIVYSLITRKTRMQLFECQNCGQLLYFENVRCEKCGCALGYHSSDAVLLSLTADDNGHFHPIDDIQQTYRYCTNAQHDVCNWLIPAEQAETFCAACVLNRTIPNLDTPEHRLYWKKLEWAKHRLVYTLLRLHLPLVSKQVNPAQGLAFDFLADPEPQWRETGTVVTGHAHGLITINIAEADDAEREKHRLQMGEPYRTLLGHFRHESGHYYWERLIRGRTDLGAFRQVFGDENLDYAQALEQHYAQPRQDWQTTFVSSYASAHPWEDWAETWAHYLHIVDTLETACAFGLKVHPRVGQAQGLQTEMIVDPFTQGAFTPLMNAWFPLTYAVNSLTRSMGYPDFYPFVLTPPVLEKFAFIHTIIQQAR